MNLPEFSIKNHVLVNLLMVLLVVVGIVNVMNMQREDFPDITIDFVIVLTPYPGASPHEVEKLVTIPIEDTIKGVDGIKSYSSSSSESSSFIFIELDPDVSNRDKVINEIGRQVDKAKLPDDAEDSEVEEIVYENPLIEIAFSGENISEDDLREHVRNLETIIKDIKGVGSIDRVGWREKEIWVEVDPADLEEYQVSLIQLMGVIQNQNINLPGGKIKSGSREIIIRTIGELETAEEFGEVIVRTNSDGRYLLVGDIATVRESFEELRVINKTNARASINIIPKKKKTADAITVVDEIKKKVKAYKQSLPGNVSVAMVNDFSVYIKRRLNILISNGWLGLVLLFLCLLFFLNVRIALVTAIGIPFSFLAALLFMSLTGNTLNMISMFGLILVLGMIVDDAIVVAENAYRYMEEGLPPREAALKGCSEVMAPVTATILTTIAAFLPLMFIAGIMGKVLKVFPVGVIFCLLASLFEAMLILPSHLAAWVKPLKSNGGGEVVESNEKKEAFFTKLLKTPFRAISPFFKYFTSNERKGSESKWFQWLLEKYTGILKFALNRKALVGILALLVLAVTVFFSIKFMPIKLFPNVVDIFYARVELPEGSSLEESGEAISLVEKAVLELPDSELENVTTTIGYSGEINRSPFDKYGTRFAQCVVYLTAETGRKRKAGEIITELRNKIEAGNTGFVLQFEQLSPGPPVGKPVAVSVKGDEYATLRKIVGEIETYMSTVVGIKDIKNDYELGKEEIQIHIDKREAARLGLDVSQVAFAVRFAFEGGVATSIRRGDENIDVIVKLAEKHSESIKTLENLAIPNRMNRLIKLSRFAEFVKQQGIKRIGHDDGRRVIQITADIDGKETTVVEANYNIVKEFEDLPARYPGYSIHVGGEWEDTTESIDSIGKAFGIAVLLIYLILATQFKSFIQPVIILVTVPFGFVGVVLALFLHGQPLSLMAMFGMVGLTGVVVNDSLILVDFINRKRAEGSNMVEAAVYAGRTRMRPILMTSITTIIALIPVVYGLGGKEPFVIPAAMAMAYGLIAATFLTLVLVPCAYVAVEKLKEKFVRSK